MSNRTALIIQVFCAFVNLPFALEGSALNLIAIGFCFGLATATVIKMAIE